MRLATVVSQAPGDSMASCCWRGHGVPAGVGLLDGVLGLGQGAEEPVGEVDQLTPLAHDRAQARVGLVGHRRSRSWPSLVAGRCRWSLSLHRFDETARANCEVRASPHISAGLRRRTRYEPILHHHPSQEDPMQGLPAIADRVEIEALRGEFTDAAMMRDRRPPRVAVHAGRRAADARTSPSNWSAGRRSAPAASGCRASGTSSCRTTHPGTIRSTATPRPAVPTSRSSSAPATAVRA